jgi:hypothetical protein
MAETWKEIAFAPELAHLQSDLREHDVQMVFVSYGDAKANRKLAEAHRLDGPFLLMKNASEALEAFRGMGTPAAYLLDKQGRVAQPLAVGADLVPARTEPSPHRHHAHAHESAPIGCQHCAN